MKSCVTGLIVRFFKVMIPNWPRRNQHVHGKDLEPWEVRAKVQHRAWEDGQKGSARLEWQRAGTTLLSGMADSINVDMRFGHDPAPFV
jgi:hypothetical protein